MDTPILAGSPSTNPSPIQPRFSSSPITTSFACSTRRASRSSRSAFLKSTASRMPTPGRSGASSRKTTTSSAAPPRVYGSTTPSKMSSACTSVSAPATPTNTTTSSRKNSRPPSSAPAPSSTSSTSRLWPPLTLLSTPWTTTRPSASPGGWTGPNSPAFRPDSVIDAEYAGFIGNIEKLGQITGEDIGTWKGYLNALRNRRAFFKSMGCTSTDHGHLTAQTADLDPQTAASLYGRILSGRSVPEEQQIFQAQMLTEMAGMSVEDGLTMQLHPGSVRNHNRLVYEKFGRDKGADMPSPTEYVRALRPLLNKYGNDSRLTF